MILASGREDKGDVKNELILLVADHKQESEAMREVLATLRYKTIIAQSGKEAVKIYNLMEGKIDLVIIDLTRKAKAETEALGLLREINPDVKVVLSNSYDAKEPPDKSGLAFIHKPFDIDEVSRTIRRILSETNEP